MSGYSRRRVACRYATEQKKGSELEKGDCDQSESQHRPQAPTCDLQKIQLSAMWSLSQSSYPSVAARFDELHQVPVEERPADPNHHKLLSKSNMECISLDADTVSISSGESDCDIREVGAWSSENASTTTAGNSDGKNQSNFLSNDLTEGSSLSNEPKLPVSPGVLSPMSTLKSSISCEDNTTKTDFIEIDESQTHSTLSSLQNNAGANSIQCEPSKLLKIRTRSFVYLKQKGVKTLSKNSDVQGESSSSVSHSPVPSDNQSNNDPEENIGNKLSTKEFCCILSWLTCIYGKQLLCSCTFPAGTAKPGQNYATRSSFSVSQLALEREPCKKDVSLMKDVNNTTNTVQNGSTSTPQCCEEPIQNKQEIHTYILKESSGVGRRKSKASELSEGENNQAKGTQEPVVNSVLELKTLSTCNESITKLLDVQLCKGNEEEKNISVDSDILSISSNESDSDIMEAGVSIPENVRRDLLPKQYISQEVTLSCPMFKPEKVKISTNANVSKSDHSKNILNTGGEKNSTQSEQSKLSMNIGGSFYVSPKQTDSILGESTEHTKCSTSILYQDTQLETPKKNFESIVKVRDNDCQDVTFIDEVVQDTQIEEQNPLRPENKFESDDKSENESAEAGCVHDNVTYEARNEKICDVREEHSLTSSIQEIPELSLASLAMSTEQQSQSLPVGDQESKFNWTDQLSEIITQFPLGIHDINTDRSSLDKETAVISQEDYSNEAIDRCLDNFEALIKQFDAKNASFLCNDRNNYELHCAMPSDYGSNDKTAEKVQKDTCNKQFCCMLSWSAYVSGEQSKCLCTSVSHATNLGVNGKVCSQISHQSCKVNVPLIKKTKTSTDKKDTRTAGLRSRPQLKTQGNISEKYIQKNCKSTEYISGSRSGLGRKKCKRANINLEGKRKSASTVKHSGLHNTRIANQLDRKKKAQQTNIQFHKGKAQPSLSKMTDTTPGLVQCNSRFPQVDNTAAAENKPNTPVKKKRDSDICVFPKKASTALANEVCCGLQAKSFPTVSQMDTAKRRINRCNKNTPVGKQDCSDQVDNSQFYLKKVEQSPLIQLCKNPFVKLISSELCKDSSSSLSNKFESSSSKQDFTFPSQISEVWPLHPANQHNLHKDIVRPKRQKVCPAKSNRSLKINISEQIMSSEKALQQVSSPMGDVGDPLTCKKNKSDCEIRMHGFHNLEVHIQEVKENQLKTCQKTQVSTEKSVTTIDTRGTFPDLETKTFSQLRKLDVEQELPKDNYSLVNEIKKNKSSIVKQNSTDLHLLPAVQKLTQEKYKEIVSEDRHDSTNKSKKQSQSLKQCFPTEAVRTRSTSRRKSPSPGLDEQNTPVETTGAPPPSVCRLESSMICDKSKVGTEKDKQNKCNLKSSIEKREDQAVTKVHKRSISRRSYLDLQTETVSHLYSQQKISINDHCVVENSNGEATPAMQKAKLVDKYEKCGQKLEYKHNLGYESKKQTPRQRKRKVNKPASERDSLKRRKSGPSNQKTVSDEKKPTCTREPSLNLEQTTRCLLSHINGDTISSICEVIEASIPNQDIRCINPPLNEKRQEPSYLSNKHYLNCDSTKLNWKKQGMEGVVLKDKLTAGLYRNQISCEPYVPLERIKATVSSSLLVLEKSTKKVGIEHDTKLMDNLHCPLEKVASPTSDTAVKVLGASCCDRPTGQSTLKEKTRVRQCVLKLCRLPLPLERQYLLDNRETGKEHK